MISEQYDLFALEKDVTAKQKPQIEQRLLAGFDENIRVGDMIRAIDFEGVNLSGVDINDEEQLMRRGGKVFYAAVERVDADCMFRAMEVFGYEGGYVLTCFIK